MQQINVTRYTDPKGVGWAGYIEPADRSWIAFIGLDGKPRFHLHRHTSGAVLPDDPAERAAFARSIDAGGERDDGGRSELP